MNKSRLGIFLVILGNILYLLYIFFGNSSVTSFGEFTSGVLLGLSIGINLVGIVLICMSFSKDK